MQDKPLLELTETYFKRLGFKVRRNVVLDSGRGGYRFDLMASTRRGGNRYAVLVKDWRRSVGVDVVIGVDRALGETKRGVKPVVVADRFSLNAKSYAERRGIILLTRGYLLKELGF